MWRGCIIQLLAILCESWYRYCITSYFLTLTAGWEALRSCSLTLTVSVFLSWQELNLGTDVHHQKNKLLGYNFMSDVLVVPVGLSTPPPVYLPSASPCLLLKGQELLQTITLPLFLLMMNISACTANASTFVSLSTMTSDLKSQYLSGVLVVLCWCEVQRPPLNIWLA